MLILLFARQHMIESHFSRQQLNKIKSDSVSMFNEILCNPSQWFGPMQRFLQGLKHYLYIYFYFSPKLMIFECMDLTLHRNFNKKGECTWQKNNCTLFGSDYSPLGKEC